MALTKVKGSVFSITKDDVGLSNVNNWTASSSVNDASTNKYSTTRGVKDSYDRGTSGINIANTKEPALASDRKRKTTVSSAAPSGGSDGDLWIQYK